MWVYSRQVELRVVRDSRTFLHTLLSLQSIFWFSEPRGKRFTQIPRESCGLKDLIDNRSLVVQLERIQSSYATQRYCTIPLSNIFLAVFAVPPLVESLNIKDYNRFVIALRNAPHNSGKVNINIFSFTRCIVIPQWWEALCNCNCNVIPYGSFLHLQPLILWTQLFSNHTFIHQSILSKMNARTSSSSILQVHCHSSRGAWT